VLEAGQSFPLWDSASVLLARLYRAAGKPRDATKLLQKVPRGAPDTAPAQGAASLLASW